MKSYRLSNCVTGYKTINFDGELSIGAVYKFNEYPLECWTVLTEVPEQSYDVVTINEVFKYCEQCLQNINDAEIIIEDDVNLTLTKIMVQNEPLFSIKSRIIISNGVETYELYSNYIQLAQNYIGGYLDINKTIPMPWSVNFPSGAVNNNISLISTGSNLEVKLPNLIDWKYFQTLPQLASAFGANATNDWLWYQQQGYQLSYKIEVENDEGVYVDAYPFDIRDYDDNASVNWTWEFFRESDNLQVTAPLAGDKTKVIVTGSATPVDYATVTVEGIESTTRWVMSSVYNHLNQTQNPLQSSIGNTLDLNNSSTEFTLEFIFDATKINAPNGVKFTARVYDESGQYSERTLKEFPLPKLPPVKSEKDFKDKCCDCKPELKLASYEGEELRENDITGLSHKNQSESDTCEFRIWKDGVKLQNSGVDYPNGFSHDPNVSAFIYNWKNYLVNHGVGCYKIDKKFTVAGIEIIEDISAYELEEFTPENASGTARVLNQFNFESLWEDSTINYTDSGFEDSYRFRGMFGNWQPNVISESNFSVLNENRTASIKSKDTYLLKHFDATECHIKRLHKLVMHSAVWRVSDHNRNNTLQEAKIYECVLDNENKEDIDYTTGSKVTGVEIVLSKRQQNSVSLFGGSVQLVQGATWMLPTVTGGGGGVCPDEHVNIYKSDGTSLIASVLAPDDYNVANSEIDIGGNQISLPATEGLNVPIVDSNDVDVSTTFSGGKVVIPSLPCFERGFIFKVNSGVDSQYTIPTGLGTFDYSAKISDGQSFSNLTGNKTIIFPDADTNYTIEIRGIFPHFQQANNSEKLKVLDVIQYGDIVWRDWFQMFDGCENLNVSATDSPNMINVVRSSYAFRDCTSMVDCGDVDMVSVEDGQYMFYNCQVFNPTNFSPTLSVLTNGYAMFYNCYVFNPSNFSPTLDVLTNGNRMFYNCQAFNPTNFSPTLDVLTNGDAMFYNCQAFNPSNFSPTLNVLTNGDRMFENCYVFNPTNFSPTLDVLTNGDAMFYNCYVFNPTSFSPTLDVLTNGYRMFENCYVFNPTNFLPTLDVLTNGNRMFYDCQAFNPTNFSPTLSVLTNGDAMFYNCYVFNPINFSPALSVLTNGNIMFYNCYVFNTSNFSPALSVLTNGNRMFYNCYVFNPSNFSPTLDLLTDGQYMFRNCYVFNPTNFSPTLDVLTNGDRMFENCQVFNPTNFSPTLSVLTNGDAMFYDCQAFNPSNFSPTLNVLTNGDYMFYNCTLSTTNYSQILINMESVNSNSNVPFNGGNSQYNTSGQTARNELVVRGWAITDGGLI